MTRGVLAIGLILVLAGCASHRPRAQDQQQDDAVREAVRLAAEADIAHQHGRYEDAIRLGRQAVTLLPSLGGAWNNLGVSLMETQNNMDAAMAFQRAADASPSDPKPYENLGVLYMQLGHGEESLRYYVRSLERDPYWLPSLRGAAYAAKSLLRSDEDGLERLGRGMMVERDPEWRKFFESERMRVSGELSQRRKYRAPS